MHPKIGISKQLPTHFKAKCEKSVGTPFPKSHIIHMGTHLYLTRTHTFFQLD